VLLVIDIVMLLCCQASNTKKSHERDGATAECGMLINSAFAAPFIIILSIYCVLLIVIKLISYNNS